MGTVSPPTSEIRDFMKETMPKTLSNRWLWWYSGSHEFQEPRRSSRSVSEGQAHAKGSYVPQHLDWLPSAWEPPAPGAPSRRVRLSGGHCLRVLTSMPFRHCSALCHSKLHFPGPPDLCRQGSVQLGEGKVRELEGGKEPESRNPEPHWPIWASKSFILNMLQASLENGFKMKNPVIPPILST